jgi:putative oxidoreductase
MLPFDRNDLGLLALRLATGGVLVAHGTQKLFGWFGGGGVEGTAKAMEAMGFHPGKESAVAAGLGEAGGGLLLALGAATPMAGSAAAGAMAGAVSVHRPAGFFSMSGGYEYPAYLGVMAAGLGLCGPGRLSFDYFTGDRLNKPAMVVLGFAAGAAAAFEVVRRRERAIAEPAEAAQGADEGVDTQT